VAYPEMDKYFPVNKLIITGNPIRQGLNSINSKSDEALNFFGIPNGNKVILVIGGSLGARTINNSLLENINQMISCKNLTLIWQTGKYYFNEIQTKLKENQSDNIKVFDFINRMDLAFSVADLVVSRAGAGTISELCVVGKPTILVPSPNVAEDHQTQNALALVKRKAAIMVKDNDAKENLVRIAIETINNSPVLDELRSNIKSLALPNAATEIAKKVIEIGNEGKK
jgi:UDP-N-acetylglucosamine--N-acetylmuramyl-(pentapeptide) pyrophosphoryl-undecaprenol N-acetylglucosamine transferase